MDRSMWRIAAIAAMTGVTPVAAEPACHINKYLDLPLLLTDNRAYLSTKLAGKDARFILDSGAFWSTMSRASAEEYALKLQPVPSWFRLQGITGDASVAFASAANFGLGELRLPKVDFLVGGSDTGTVGLLGQNFLGFADVEYDLPHGALRLMEGKDCPLSALPYWAGVKPVTVLPLQKRQPPFNTHTIGTVVLNGVKLRALFDTGAESSILTMAAAKRAGLTPKSPGVVASEMSTGIGARAARTWIGTFTKLDIGGEIIPTPKLEFGEIMLGDSDMLIGIDFFRTHRVYVANKAAKMLFTYEGGPVFGLKVTRAVDAGGKALDMTDGSAKPTDAAGFSRRGSVLAANGRLEAALADFDRAVALAPADANHLRLRAAARLANRQPLLAGADLDKAIALDPADAEARMMRAGLRLDAHDPAGAREDLRAAEKVLPPTSDTRLRLASMFDAADDPAAALSNFDAWLKVHLEDSSRPTALNGRCWVRGLLNRELDRALADCNQALRLRPGNAAFLDSRALIRLRRGELTQALADYNAALKASPRSGWSLYARGVVRKRLGDAAGAAADRTAALALEPDVAERGRKLGLDN